MPEDLDAARERRRAERYVRHDLSVTIYESGQQVMEPEVVVRDISRTGLGLQLAGRVNVGQDVAFKLDLPEGSVQGTGRVRWVREGDTGGNRCGVRIDRLGMVGSHRLRMYLEPDSFDFMRIVDTSLMLAALGTALVLTASMLGFELPSVADLKAFLQYFF